MAVVVVATAVVVTVNVAVELPAATVTVAGTVALDEFDASPTLVPPAGALPLMVTVPVEEFPPTTVVGARVTDESVRTVTEIVWVRVVPLYVALNTEDPFEAKAALVLMVNVADEDPAGTVTDVGTVATEVVADESEMTMPPTGAAADNVTVPVDVLPAETDDGEMVKVLRVGLFTEAI